MNRPSTENARETKSPIPQEVHDLLDYLEGGYDDDGRFNSTSLWPWRNLELKRWNLNERILRIVLNRLVAPKASLDGHWRRLHADVQEHRRRNKARGKLASADAAGITIGAVVDALLPVREASAKEIRSVMHNASRAATELTACLTRLRDSGMNLGRLLPTAETIHEDDEKSGGKEYGGAYADARFFIHMRLPGSLTPEQRAVISDYALRVVMGDPFVATGILKR